MDLGGKLKRDARYLNRILETEVKWFILPFSLLKNRNIITATI